MIVDFYLFKADRRWKDLCGKFISLSGPGFIGILTIPGELISETNDGQYFIGREYRKPMKVDLIIVKHGLDLKDDTDCDLPGISIINHNRATSSVSYAGDRASVAYFKTEPDGSIRPDGLKKNELYLGFDLADIMVSHISPYGVVGWIVRLIRKYGHYDII